MNRFRAVLLSGLCVCLVSTIYVLLTAGHTPPFKRSLAPFFQELGKPVQSADRIVSKLLPVNEIDEKSLGEEIKARFETRTSEYPADLATRKYLQSLVTYLTKDSKKPFQYTVFLIDGLANAYALPGGVICVTQGLVDLVTNEAELVWVLGHEVGHIERGHLFSAVRGEMLRRKIKEISLVSYVDDVLRLPAMLVFSKTQEDEADEYGFRVLITQGYNPYAASQMAEKFLSLESKSKDAKSKSSPDPVGEFIATHPHMELRCDKFLARAHQWHKSHPTAKWYFGERNLQERIAQNETFYIEESQIIVLADRS